MGLLRKRDDDDNKKKTKSSSTSPCAHLRTAYHNCFNRWYSEKFVKGLWHKEECVVEWHHYRHCLSQHLDDKQLSRFLEAEGSGIFNSADQVDEKSSFDDSKMGSASE